MTRPATSVGVVDQDDLLEEASSGGAYIGVPFIVEFRPAAAGDLDYTVPTGRTLRVLDAWGYKTVGAGVHVDDEVTIENNGANNIFATTELAGVGDGDRIAFTDLDDAHDEVTAGNALRVMTNEDAAGGCDCIVCVLCVWV